MLLAVAALGAALASADEPVARVNSRFIGAEAVAARIAASRAAGGTDTAEEVLDALVAEALLAEEGERLGLGQAPEVADRVAAERRRLAAERFAAVEIEGAVRVDEQMLRQIYRSGDAARLELLVVPSRSEAEAIAGRLRGGGDFAAEARRSLDPAAAAAGGKVGFRTRAVLDPALADAVFAAAPGALVGPVEQKLGWAVARVLEIRTGDEAGFAEKREALAEYARSQAVAQAVQHLRSRMRARSGVTLDEKFLESLGARVEPNGAEGEHVLAEVAGRPVRYRDILPAVRRLAAGKEGGHASGPTVKGLVAWAEVDRLLLEEEALRRGYGRDPAVAQAARAAEREIVGRSAAERIRRSVPAPTEAEIAAWYDGHRAQYRVPGSRRCSHIVLHSRERAEQVLGWLRAGEAFEGLAATYSTDAGSAPRGGDLGELSDERLEALAREEGLGDLAAALRRAPAGEVAGPVGSRLGWHLVRCGPPSPPRGRPLGEVREEIAARISRDRGEAALRRRVAELRAAARVTVEPEALRRAAARAEHPPRPSRKS